MSFIKSLFNFIFSHPSEIYVACLFLGFSTLLFWYSFTLFKKKKSFTKSDRELFLFASVVTFVPVINLIFFALSLLVWSLFIPDFLRERKYPHLKVVNKITKLINLHRKHFSVDESYDGWEDDETPASEERKAYRAILTRLESVFKNRYNEDAFSLLLVRYDYAFSQILEAVEKCSEISLKATEEIFLSSQDTLKDVLTEMESILDEERAVTNAEITNLTKTYKAAIEQERLFQKKRKTDPVVIALSKKM